MNITNSVLNEIFKKVRFEYSGCHSPDKKNPLWGRAAYWRAYIGGSFVCNITTPVNVMNPRKSTLEKLLKKEVRKRIEAITEIAQPNHYGQIYIYSVDPYSVRPLVESIDREYLKSSF